MTTKTVYDGFSGPAGSPPDPDLWGYDLGNGWGGGEELQTYTDSPDNVYQDGDGHLVIKAISSDDGYTSGRIKTEGKLNMGYGLIEASIKMPSGQGTLPAFWLLGSNYSTVGSPSCGEIDIIEYVDLGTEAGFPYHFTLHGPQNAGDYQPPGAAPGTGLSYSQDVGFDPSAGFHTYWVRRAPDSITIGIDDTIWHTFTPASLPAGATWVFNNQPMFAILSFAIGGSWAGPPDATTVFPQSMLVDWFRYTPVAAAALRETAHQSGHPAPGLRPGPVLAALQ